MARIRTLAGGIATTLVVAGIGIIGPSAPAQAAYPDCIVTNDGDITAKSFCVGNGTAFYHKVAIKCVNTSWNPAYRGDIEYFYGPNVRPGRESVRACGNGQSSAWDLLWQNVIITS
jgi:hypothetical protein